MKLCAIDPGQQTGITIGDLHILKKSCAVVPILCDTMDTNGVYKVIQDHKPDAVVMEDTAVRPSREGLAPWEIIWNGLYQLGYERSVGHGLAMQYSKITLISPGIWKPVMRIQQINWSVWSPSTPHEHDAVRILHYWIRVNHSHKEIEYV